MPDGCESYDLEPATRVRKPDLPQKKEYSIFDGATKLPFIMNIFTGTSMVVMYHNSR